MKQNKMVEPEFKVRIPQWRISPAETWTHWSTRRRQLARWSTWGCLTECLRLRSWLLEEIVGTESQIIIYKFHAITARNNPESLLSLSRFQPFTSDAIMPIHSTRNLYITDASIISNLNCLGLYEISGSLLRTKISTFDTMTLISAF